MRSALVAVLVLAACATPVGEDRTGCGADWLDAEPVAASARGTGEQPLPIECMHQIANRRVRVGFLLPAGPTCHLLKRVELVESADAVSITLVGAVDDDPAAGACPEEPRRVVTEMDLAAPIDDRVLLDGSSLDES
jgi:hypothetical protein